MNRLPQATHRHAEDRTPRDATGRPAPAKDRKRQPLAVGRIGIVADFGMAIGMRVLPGRRLVRQHLRTEADPEKRFVLPQRHRDPVDLTANEFIPSVALIGPPKMIAPACSAMVSGKGSPNRGWRMSSDSRAGAGNDRDDQGWTSPDASRSESVGAWRAVGKTPDFNGPRETDIKAFPRKAGIRAGRSLRSCGPVQPRA